MTREQWIAQQEAEEAALLREAEWRRITRRLDALYAAQTAGDDSVYTRQRIDRLERLQAALCGFAEALAG